MRASLLNNSICLVTGAHGFVGSAICEVAQAAGIRIVSHARNPDAGADLSGDLSELSNVQRLPLQHFTHVIHCAAATPARSHNYSRDNEWASEILARVLEKSKALVRVVDISSVSVYSQPDSDWYTISEQSPVIEAIRPDGYPASKRRGELAFERHLGHRREVGIVHLRPSSIYGRNMQKNTLLPVFAQQAARGEPLRLIGPRNYTQNFIHVMDVAALAVAACDIAVDGIKVVNAFSDDTYTLPDLARFVSQSLKSSSPIIDNTSDTPIAMPLFDNVLAKLLIGDFRPLSEHLRDVL